MIPAILCNDKIVTGLHHGEAFSKLNETEKNSNLLSGFIDNLKFICDDDKVLYLKEIILIRHAESNGESITKNGVTQAQKVAAFLFNMNLKNYKGFCSPYTRCQETSSLIKNICSITFTMQSLLSEKLNKESNTDFNQRIKTLLELLPEKSILVTHTDFIQNILEITNIIHEQIICIANCSITYIYKNRLVWLAKDVEETRN